MKTIWKFVLVITDQQEIEMPWDAEILSVQFQGEQLCLWALVEPGLYPKPDKRLFLMFGTGHPIRDELLRSCRFVATVQHHKGQLVWHVFEGEAARVATADEAYERGRF